MIFLDEESRLEERAKVVAREFSESMTSRLEKGYLLPKQMEMLFAPEEIFGKLAGFRGVTLSALETKDGWIRRAGRFHIRCQSVGSYNQHFELLVKDLQKYRRQKYKVLLLSPSRSRAKRLAQELMDQGLSSFYSEDRDHGISPGEIMVTPGTLGRGFAYPDSQFVLLTEGDIFGQHYRKKKKKVKRYEGEKISGFSDLHVGDYVVHENHGLGIYQGIEKMEVDKVVKDYIKISYAKGGNLYILATQLDSIAKYSGQEERNRSSIRWVPRSGRKPGSGCGPPWAWWPGIWWNSTPAGRTGTAMSTARTRYGRRNLRRRSPTRRPKDSWRPSRRSSRI